jgi:hypothetical protein
LIVTQPGINDGTPESHGRNAIEDENRYED